MMTQPVQLAAIITILAGTYYIATIYFQWGISTYLRCELFALDVRPITSAPAVMLIALVFIALSVLELVLVTNFDLLGSIILDWFLMLLSWSIFFRSILNFKRIPTVGLVIIIICVTAISASSYFTQVRLAREGKPFQDLRGWVSEGNAKLAGLNREEVEIRSLVANTALKLVQPTEAHGEPPSQSEPDPVQAPSRSDSIDSKIDLSGWGEGSEKGLLRYHAWLMEVINREERAMDQLLNVQMNFLIWLLLATAIMWIIPMSVVAGKLIGFVRLRNCDSFVSTDDKNRKFIISQTFDWIVLADNTLRDSPRQYIPASSIERTLIRPTYYSPVKVLRDILNALFSRRDSQKLREP